MKKTVANLILLIITLCSPGILTAQTTRTAGQLLSMEQFNHAKSAYQKMAGSASSWFYLGKIYSIQDKTDSARICFAKIAAADPKSNLIQVGQALTENLSGNKAAAILLLDKAQKTPAVAKDVPTLIEIAEALAMCGDTTKWVNVLTNASGVERKNPAPFIAAGKLYKAQAERTNLISYYGLASGRFEQALYNDPQNIEAQTCLADMYILARNYSDAESKLDQVINADSMYLPALKSLGELCYTLGKYEKASKSFGRYIRNAEYTDKDLSRYVNILYFNKEYSKANELINKILSTNPSNAVMLRLKGYTSYELNNFQDGLNAMDKFFKLRSTSDTSKIIATDYEYLGKLQAKSCKDSIAAINLNKAYEMDPSKLALLEEIAKSYEKQKDYRKAVGYYEQYVAARKGSALSTVQFNIGKDLLLIANELTGTADSLQRPEYLVKADSAFGKVIEYSPNSYLGYLWRARVEAGLDPETSTGLAKPDYEKALEILEAKNDKQKYGKDMMEAYRYLGYFHYLRYDAAKTAKDDVAREQAKSDSMKYWQKVLELEATNEVAKQAITALQK